MTIEKLNAQEIMDLLDHKMPVFVHNSLASTNDYLLDLIKNSSDVLPQTAVLAEMQTAGKGRQGRTWVSPPGNVYLSLYWPFKCSLDQLYGLSLVIGIAVARVLKANRLEAVKLKWPNDIFWQDRKLGGILVETKPNQLGVIDVVIGIGLNIHDMESYHEYISQKFVALENAVQHKINRNKIVAQLLVELNKILTQFTQFGFDHFIEEWKFLDLAKGNSFSTH